MPGPKVRLVGGACDTGEGQPLLSEVSQVQTVDGRQRLTWKRSLWCPVVPTPAGEVWWRAGERGRAEVWGRER